MKIPFLISLIFIPLQLVIGQSSFSFNDYQLFLQENENITTQQLLETHNAGEFNSNTYSGWNNALYHDSIEIKLNLTEGEKSLIEKNGFVVSERLSRYSFVRALGAIYHHDLPVFVTTDMILHSFHRSYDEILKTVEITSLIPKLEEFLEQLNFALPLIEEKYTSDFMKDKLKDIDIFLSVPRKLLNEQSTPYYAENIDDVDQLISKVLDEQFLAMPFFSGVDRKIDFSQFKPRGHYDSERYPQLKAYFRTMIWLGKMELYLIAPQSLTKPTLEDVQRQAVMANLILELMQKSNSEQIFNEIEKVIEAFVGEQDNVTFNNLESLKSSMGFNYSSALSDTIYFKAYQDTLADQPFAPQKILSQVLIHDPGSEDEIEPASAFMIFGQRFVIDSYISANVVYDKVKLKRMLPSTLDILYGIGNDAAAQLLVDELETYKYSSNLLGVRYLVDAYDDDFWNSTIYNGWLNSIRKLNPPSDRTIYPEFMQTAAWWQQKMNTQLASWTELRHDNLLYAKQSYTGGATCSYPYSYVEPFPEFYSAMKEIALNFKNKMVELNYSDERIEKYFDHLYGVNDTLETIASKELSGTVLTNSEIIFLQSMLAEEASGCVVEYTGWYPKLFYSGYDFDFIVADYHTSPTDAGGTPVGWVKHAGTGKIDLIIMNTKLPDGKNVAFVGPVASYHEYTSTNFYRLTDQEWQYQYLLESTRPEWTNIYLADINGDYKTEGLSLITDTDEEGNERPLLPETHLIGQNYPNPFNPSTKISFNIPSRLTNSKTRLAIYDIQGNKVKELINETLPTGNYLIEWNGTSDKNQKVSSGVYFYEIRVNTDRFVGKMNLIK